ncbi:MAG: hypothetical protein ACRCZI_09745 [Cetobacterium sp.]
MSQEIQMPNVHELLVEMDAAPESHLIVAALPRIIAEGLRTWGKFDSMGLEDRITATMNAVAVSMQEAARVENAN